MENNTKEKGLIKVNDNFFTKIRRYLMQMFSKKYNKIECAKDNDMVLCNEIEKENSGQSKEVCEENINVSDIEKKNKNDEEVYEAKEEIERKLMNYYESIKKCI